MPGRGRRKNRGGAVQRHSAEFNAELRPVDDCYALNAAQDATWAHYYSDFPLVHSNAMGDIAVLQTAIGGAHVSVQIATARGHGSRRAWVHRVFT